MALSQRDLRELKTALTDGIKEGFKDINTGTRRGTTARGGTTGGNSGRDDDSGADYVADEKKRKKEIEKLLKQNKEIDEGGYGDTDLGKAKKKENLDRVERLRNGGISNSDVEKHKKQQKIDKANNIAGKAIAAVNVVKAIGDVIIAFEKRRIAIANAQADYSGKMAELNLKRQSVLISQGMNNIANGFGKTASEMAYDNTQAAYEISKTATLTGQQEKIAGQTFRKEVTAANAAFAATAIGAGVAIGAAIGSVIPGIGTAVGAVIGAVGGAIVSLFQSSADNEIARQELHIKEAEIAAKVTEQQLEQLKSLAKPFDDLYKNISELVLQINDSAKKFGVTIGYTGDDFAKSVVNITQKSVTGGESLVKLFGKEAEKLPEYMSGYMNASGRQVNMSAEDYGNVMGTARLFGMSGGESAQLYGSMNIFNTSISSASDAMGHIYHQITRMGLSSKKFGKDLVQNLKLAEKYNFKGGVENMMKITKWAMQTRFNLKNATNFADTLMNGSLSESLEKSAQLQVLGGAAARFSDPLGMMYDAWNDTGDLAKRMEGMFSDITGTFDKKTGNVDFGTYGNMMIAQRAKAMGMDVGEARNMMRQKVHQAQIDQVLKGTGISDEDRLALGNRATYNEKSGRWEVTDKNNVTHDILEYANGQASLDDLLPVETDKAILEVVKESLSVQERISNTTEAISTKMGAEEQGKIYQTTENMRQQQESFYENHWAQIKQGFNSARVHTEKLFSANIELMDTMSKHINVINQIYRGLEHDVVASVRGTNLNSIKDIANTYQWGGDNLGNKNYHKFQSQDDGYGNTNGGIISGASNVTPINDGAFKVSGTKAINDGAVRVKTANNDQYLAAKPNGPIDKILQQLIPGLQMLVNQPKSPYERMVEHARNGGANNNISITVDGRLILSQDGESINLVEIMKNNPSMANKFIDVMKRAIDVNKTGKSLHNYMM